MTGRLGQAGRWARQGLLTVGAVLGVVCILVTLGAALFGLRPLVFESGSMSPTIKTGDLAISRGVDASSLQKGDIVSVPTSTGSRVTHRIVSVEHVGRDAILRLRGDANTATDATHYRVSHADRVLFHVPRLGYVVGWLSGPTGLFLLGLYAAFLLSVLFRRSPAGVQAEPASAAPLCSEMRVIPPSPRAGRRKTPRKKRGPRMLTGGLSLVLMVGLAAGALVQRSVTPTLAAWTDAATASGTTLTAYTVPAPVLTCSFSGASATVTWPAVSGSPPPLSYAGAVSGITTSSVSGPALASGTWTYVVNWSTSGSTNKGKTGIITITASLTNSGTWVSTATKTVTTGNNGSASACN